MDTKASGALCDLHLTGPIDLVGLCCFARMFRMLSFVRKPWAQPLWPQVTI